MWVIAVKTLKEFRQKHPDSEQPLKAWYAEARKANWKSSSDIKNLYRSTGILKNNRVVFNIKGNSYRLVVAIKYKFQIVFIRFIGMHNEYDRIKAEEI